MAIEEHLHQVTTTAHGVHDAAEEHERAIVAAYEAGASMADISAASIIDGNGTGQYTEEGVRRLLQRRGVSLRPRGRPPKHDNPSR